MNKDLIKSVLNDLQSAHSTFGTHAVTDRQKNMKAMKGSKKVGTIRDKKTYLSAVKTKKPTFSCKPSPTMKTDNKSKYLKFKRDLKDKRSPLRDNQHDHSFELANRSATRSAQSSFMPAPQDTGSVGAKKTDFKENSYLEPVNNDLHPIKERIRQR